VHVILSFSLGIQGDAFQLPYLTQPSEISATAPHSNGLAHRLLHLFFPHFKTSNAIAISHSAEGR